MASLNKLAIRGIRSFDDKQISVIEFFSPVTVIVGHNGSGKTTIIECLKYATTGDQPPNTRGGAFVHDPKMANEKEVKAQVKLRFHAANGTRMLVVRNLSVTMKKTNMAMKTLENILALADGNADKGGKRGVISTKCAEIDTEIPQLLGVSKAVLENVIFCHQEDSWWPLSEPSALKKKFDDIFEATRYTKALDSIKSLRKDRVAELKAEKERLVGLSREKAHSDKLKARIAELNSTIAVKEVTYEETKKKYEETVESNQKLYDYATKFSELYLKVEGLQEKKDRLQADMDDAKLNLQELAGTDNELQQRLQHFDEHINAQKQRKRLEDNKRQDLEDELASVRRRHTQLVALHGRLVAEADAQKQRIAEREQTIREISERYGIRGFSHSPLEREKVVEFLTKVADVQRRQKVDLERLQNELRSSSEEYNRNARQLDSELQGHKLQKKSLRDQLAERQSSILSAERTLENQQGLPSQLRALHAEIEEKEEKLAKIKADIVAAKYDVRLTEKAEKSRLFEERREQLNTEIRSLSLQADARAKLDLKRGEAKAKRSELASTLEVVNKKFRKFRPNKDVTAETAELELEKITSAKELEQNELEAEVNTANGLLQKSEATITNVNEQLNAKKREFKALDNRLRNEVEQDTLEAGIKEAYDEINHRKTSVHNLAGSSSVYESLLRIGKQKKICHACNRHLEDDELAVFEEHLKELIKRASPESVEKEKEELADWENELERLQKLRPVQAARDQLKYKELPALEEQKKKAEAERPDFTHRAEEATERLEAVKQELKEVTLMREHARTAMRLQREIGRAEQDAASIESDLLTTGTAKTTDDVQMELDTISAELRTNERDKQAIMHERERQNAALRNVETSLHTLELRERDLQNDIKERTALEQKIETMKAEVASFSSRAKDLEAKITEAQAPINALEEQFRQTQSELNSKISEAQRLSQEFNMNVDKLANINKAVERYVKERRGKQLEECAQNIEQHEEELGETAKKIEAAREVIAAIDKEINASGASVANYRENIRVRKLAKEIAETQTEIDQYDMEEAARARRNFQEKFTKAKELENELQTKYSHIAGEVSSLKTQRRSSEDDLKEFKDINKRYTDQLIKVKMSDMANNDLEKYAKALDNAIMKYHSLKMEEVNDTMKHLWNKTYQGTDIDGIKIRSDVEGGASKRSYNYRVVMTKDQVEMDMRGRCSAGQKMLASIIIRLALSDSFGQNCGILALDEPTNALDTENIDALAASLVDIINERKSHSNFQLIIITHDENFLRKLGQSDVMEYYWRVSRDSRQKSVIERQRFR